MNNVQTCALSSKISSFFESELSFFPNFLPFNQIMNGQKLHGLFPTESFFEIVALGIYCKRIRLILECSVLPDKNIKVFGEIYIAYTRACKICTCQTESSEVIPFSFLLFLKNDFLKNTCKREFFNPNFLKAHQSQDGIALHQMIEHYVLRALAFNSDEVYCRLHQQVLFSKF